MGTHISINNGLIQTFFSHETKLQKKRGKKKTQLEAVTRHILLRSEAHNLIHLRDY